MRILADENVPKSYVETLLEAGHDVSWIARSAPGATDREVLEYAEHDQRTVLTLDHDFALLAFRMQVPVRHGVLFVRRRGLKAPAMALVLAHALAERDDWADHFSVIEPDRVRMVQLPGGDR